MFSLCFNGTNRDPKVLVLIPFSANLLLCLIITSILVKSAILLESHVEDIDSRDLARWEKMHLALASGKIKDINEVSLWDTLMVVLHGRINVDVS